MSVCAYCGIRRAETRDHVVPKTLVRKGHAFSAKRRHALNKVDPLLLSTVGCCLFCNIRKGTRKLVPPSWKDRIPALKEAIPGEWRVWDGDPMSPAFREVWR